MKRPLLLLSLILSMCAFLGGTLAAETSASAQDKAVYPPHPRIILTDERLDDLKAQAETDPLLESYVDGAIAQADETLDIEPLTYRLPDGKRLLRTSKDCLGRVITLGFAYRWTGDPKYLNALLPTLRAVCEFPDWNPRHFLDTAEMTNAVGIAYDWLYPDLDEQDRELMRQALISHGLEPALLSYAGKGPNKGWPKAENNWNLVCNGGIIVGALAVADSDPEYVEEIIPLARESMKHALKLYAPDGAWAEGLGYWNYATRYLQYAQSAMETALGTDYGILETDGLSETAYFPIFSVGPTGKPLNFSDCNITRTRQPTPTMLWLAGVYGNAFVVDQEHRLIKEARSNSPQYVIWYVPVPDEIEADIPLDKCFRGSVELAFMRSAWNDPQAIYLGIKAGRSGFSHSHLDLGNFELDALGVRWAVDLGADNYNMPGYFDVSGGRRWQYYRTSSFSHNVPTLNGQNQKKGRSKLVEFQAGDGDRPPFAQIQLTQVYKDQAESVMRGASLVADRRAALVQDEFDLPAPTTIDWGITTNAEIELDGATATLIRDGQTLRARILSPDGAVFSVKSAAQKPPQNENKGYKRLMIHLLDQVGEVRLAVLFSPVWPDGEVETWAVVPLNQWGEFVPEQSEDI